LPVLEVAAVLEAAAELAAAVLEAAAVVLLAAVEVVLEVVVLAAQATRPRARTATRRMAMHFFIMLGSS
jgi:hypothetical protein